MTDTELKEMIMTSMGNGLLENLIDMFKEDPSLIRFIPDMIKTNNLRIKIGVIALVQEIGKNPRNELEQIVPPLIDLLKNNDPVLKGDVAYILSILKSPSSLPALKSLCNDENPDVREIALEALEDY